MNRSDRIEILKKLGFSEYEAKCYLALFGNESLRVNEVASIADIPRPSAYEALKRLHGKGFCVSLPGRTKKFAASDPRYLRDKSFESLSDAIKSTEILYDELDSLFKGSNNNNNPLEYIRVIKDRHQIHHKYIELCSEAQREILSFTKQPYVFKTKEQRQEQSDPQYDALKRGVKIKSIYETPTDQKDKLAFVDWIRDSYGGEGDEVKTFGTLPIKLAIFDEKTVLFVMPDPISEKVSITTVVVDNQALASTFKMLFDSVWNQAKDYILIGKRRISLVDTKAKVNRRRKIR